MWGLTKNLLLNWNDLRKAVLKGNSNRSKKREINLGNLAYT
jgi:hypothetical protein